MGRRKIEIQPLSDERTKTVTFVKRKAGLFKKAYELSVLCEVDMAVIIVGSDKIYEYSSVDTKVLMNYYKHQRPYELKLPEDYGEYKKRRSLQAGTQSAWGSEDMALDEMNSESEYDSMSPEPKRQKKASSPSSSSSIYGKQPLTGTQFVQPPGAVHGAQMPSADMQQLQRPVLRVQIPLEAKSLSNSANKVTPKDINVGRKEKQMTPVDEQARQHQHQSQLLDTGKFSFNGKFRSPETKKQMQPLDVPMNKLQSLSLSAAAMPQLPINGNAGFLSTLPPPSPSGQYPPSILPTPVFNQVFNQQYMSQMNGMLLSVSGQGVHNAVPGPSSINATNGMLHAQSFPPSGDAGGDQNGAAGELEPAKLKPPLQHSFMNGEQTPVSGLPSRYMNEIFPSPSNLYPSQEWPTGLTPFSSTMSQYFAGIPPSASSLMPPSMNAVFANSNRANLPKSGGGQRQMPARTLLSLNVPMLDFTHEEEHQLLLTNTVAQLSTSEFMGQYLQKE